MNRQAAEQRGRGAETLACWYLRSGSLSRARSTTSSNLTSTSTLREGGANFPRGSSPVSIS